MLDALKLLTRMRGVRVGMLGDLILDIYLYSRPARISREAPVLIVEEEEVRYHPGGGANTLANLLALGAEVSALGLVGRDEEARRLNRLLTRQRGLDLTLHRLLPRTIAKTRIMAGDRHTVKQQVIRVDRESLPLWNRREERRLLDWVERVDRKVAGWMVSDYGYQLITPALVARLQKIAAAKVVVADARAGLSRYAGITAVTPNEAEFVEVAGREWKGERELAELMTRCRRRQAWNVLLVTRGNRGMALKDRNQPVRFLPISGSDEIVDVSGAGDTVTAVFGLALMSGAEASAAAELANVAAGQVVMKSGAVPVDPGELVRELKKKECAHGR